MAMISTEARLREILGSPTALVAEKVSDRLNVLTRQLVERSPFVCVASCRPGGGLDVSPRGDPAGFVRVLDDRSLLLPERPGNRLGDTLTNVVADPRIARLSGLWNPYRHVDRSELPSSGAMLRAVADADLDAAVYDRERAARYARREGLY
jgi:uncharacterized protein